MKRHYYIALISIVLLFLGLLFISNIPKQKHFLYEHLSYLASDKLQGRYPTTAGDTLARKYIKNQIIKNKIKPHFQSFEYLSYIDIESSIQIARQDSVYNLNFETDYIVKKQSASGKFGTKLSYLGFGIQDSAAGYDDFNKLDLTGKVVILYYCSPNNRNTLVYQLEKKTNWRTKIRSAKQSGAAGVILVAPNDKMERLIPVRKNDPVSQRTSQFNIPVINLSRKTLHSVMSEVNIDLSIIEDKLRTSTQSIAFEIPTVKLCMNITNDYVYKNAYNIYGIISGHNPTQSIIIGAHYDHIAPKKYKGIQDTIRNGADDNASGTSLLLELSKKFAGGDTPACNLVFVFFSAEEGGMWGSKYFINHQPARIGKIKAMINLDMVGRMRGDSLYINHGSSSEVWQNIFHEIQDNSLTLVWDKYEGMTDAHFFRQKEIPSIWITTGFHCDIHRVTDEVDKINFEGMNKILDLLYKAVQSASSASYQ